MRLALIVAMPFLGALLPMLLARAGRRVCAVGTGVTTLMALTILLTHAPAILEGQVFEFAWEWIPQIGMNVEFRLDGLGLLMASLILLIGLLVIIYAKFYLAPREPVGVFFTYLLIFQGAMVGIALSNNVLSLIVFWELTSLASFLLIGFWRHLPEGRQGARMALMVTGAGGLSLTAGLILLGKIAGSYRINEIIAQAQTVQESSFYPLILGLVCIGCFTKSAQFPFHFWLPRAMAAPTPVSAYLHSATMVKAGIFLLARLWPVLSGTDAWFYIVTTVGAVTMLVGSVTALFKNDLKAMMAYSTISHLGLMTMLLGLGTTAGVIACLLHLFNHAFFKASLFMNVGIVDHAAGTRDLNRLGGLIRIMPITAVAALLAVSANAGLPPLNGFLSKELMLEESWETHYLGRPGLLGILATLAGVFGFAYSLRYFAGVYLAAPKKPEGEPHPPELGLAFSPALLAIAALATGIFPGVFSESLISSAVYATTASEKLPKLHFHLWHGWTPALYSSIVAVMLGLVLFNRWSLVASIWRHIDQIDGKRVFNGIVGGTVKGCQSASSWLQNGSLPNYLVAMLVTTMLLGCLSFITSSWQIGNRPQLPANALTITMSVILGFAAVATVVFHHHRLLSFIIANVVGLITCIGFVYLSAPDLALTQMAVEVVTLILILLALFFLPKGTPCETPHWRKLSEGALSGLAGMGMAGLSWVMMRMDLNRDLSNYFIQQSKPAGGGANIVNVTLVDFRGFDTFSEIAVLSIAALTIYSLLDGAIHGPAARRLDHWIPDQPRTKEKHPKLMMIPTRVLFPMALLVGSYMFLRGHNEPGGGFVAGLVVTIAMIIQYMVSGYKWADERIRIDAHTWIALGLLLAAATGAGAMVMGYPFLTNAHGHLHLPLLGDVELSSAMVFDTGVLLSVVGAMMLTLANLARLGRRAEKAAERAAEEQQREAIQRPETYQPNSGLPDLASGKAADDSVDTTSHSYRKKV
jgi:multicomponent K+:H+ antiporter subunit A